MTDTIATQKVRQLRAKVKQEREAALTAALDLAERADSDKTAAGELEFALQRAETLDRRLSVLPKIGKVREPDMYERNGPHGFFADMLAASGVTFTGLPHPGVAQERLRVHNEYEQTRAQVAGDIAARTLGLYDIQARDKRATQARALSDTEGSGLEFLPPKWMVELFGSVSRSPCVLKGMVTKVDLPPDCFELVIPRFTSSGGVVPMEVENVAPEEVVTGPTDRVNSTVATFAGDALISQQDYERSGLFNDEVIVREFAESYGESLQQQLIEGSGENGQLLGLLNVAGTTLVTYTDATPTPAKIIQAAAKCAAKVTDARRRPPNVFLMRGSRWFSLAGGLDGEEPVERPGTGLPPSDPDSGPFGPIVGLPVYLDAMLPDDLGAGSNQDVIVAVRTKDIILLEDPVGPRFIPGIPSIMAGQLTVPLTWHTYAAAFTQRYPSAIGSVQGTGLATPEGY